MSVQRVCSILVIYHMHHSSGILVIEMLLAILSICSEEELEDTSSDEDMDETRTIPDVAPTPSELSARREQIKNKILVVGRMQRLFQLLRCDFLYLY